MTRSRKYIWIVAVILLVLIGKNVLYHVFFPISYKEYIVTYSREYEIDPYLLSAIINTESKFRKDAVSNKGAVGLMQLTESTAIWIAESMGDEDFEIHDLYDPETNIKMGSWYIDNIRKEFETTELVLAAYNAGRGNVKEWIDHSVIAEDGNNIDKIPFDETQNYIQKVLKNQKLYKILYRMD